MAPDTATPVPTGPSAVPEVPLLSDSAVIGGVPVVMVKLASLISVVAAFAASLTRMRPWVVAELGTVHASEPSLAVEAVICVHVEPALSEYSSFTLAIVPVEDHVIVVALPPVNDWPPLGAVNVTLLDALTVIVKLALLMSLVAETDASLTRTRPCVVAEEGTVHASEPSLVVEAVITVQLVPPFTEYSNLTLAIVPVEDHVIVVALPPVSDSPPLGAVTVTEFEGVVVLSGDSHNPRPYVAARILPALT